MNDRAERDGNVFRCLYTVTCYLYSLRGLASGLLVGEKRKCVCVHMINADTCREDFFFGDTIS